MRMSIAERIFKLRG